MPKGAIARKVKSGEVVRPADRRALLAFHDEFPDARLVLLNDAALRERQGPIDVIPCAEFLRGIVRGESLIRP